MRVVVVGGGVLGTMHAWTAIHRGHEVVHIERELAARGASVRNFGLVWVSGRADGPELAAARRGRDLWSHLAETVPGVGFRPAGSITVVRTEAEWQVANAACDLATAKERGFELLSAADVRSQNPALRGDFIGGLFSGADAVVEPRSATHAVRQHLQTVVGYDWIPGREVRSVGSGRVRDDQGQLHEADVVILCPGATLAGLAREVDPGLPVRRVRLQMMQTAPLEEQLTTAVADGDSFRYYPAYRGPALDALHQDQPQGGIARDAAMQLLMVQRADGGLTIGDTHAYEEPFDFDVTEDAYLHLLESAQSLLGRQLPPVQRRWAGVYAETLDRSLIVHRREVAGDVWLVTGPGGRGMTCAPAIAEQTMWTAGL